MCAKLKLIADNGGETWIEDQGELAILVGEDRLVFNPGYNGHVHSYEPEVCLCPVDVPTTMAPEYTVERDEDGDWRAERRAASEFGAERGEVADA